MLDAYGRVAVNGAEAAASASNDGLRIAADSNSHGVGLSNGLNSHHLMSPNLQHGHDPQHQPHIAQQMAENVRNSFV